MNNTRSCAGLVLCREFRRGQCNGKGCSHAGWHQAIKMGAQACIGEEQNTCSTQEYDCDRKSPTISSLCEPPDMTDCPHEETEQLDEEHEREQLDSFNSVCGHKTHGGRMMVRRRRKCVQCGYVEWTKWEPVE